ncbi:hypothetical protein K450DRAFT_249479 [Umbelopsis ramanniana AG]|uniref:Defective in cullin neddylation protein n=1 Tax=Umbelopsis ramanniana AG TaxID=1314678 RepID=A0AAD5HCK9_UMBRA|nr:uncharacterized protein K450DRAFT_249479 [Umbelopsis ramanniana AG]KAI8578009.1 hypothetical protein K450DRAFT_249479 [Umbelopsis ramanniana AG]
MLPMTDFLFHISIHVLTNRHSKCTQTAIIMWGLLLGNQSSHVESFATFLTEKQPVKVINRDQWQSFLEFATTVSDDFHDYDEMSAWPVLFDDFVEWKRERLDPMQS